MAIDMFDSRTMLEAFKQRKSPIMWLRDTFFGNVRTFDTDSVDIDVVKAKRRTACYIKPTLPGETVSRDGFETRSYKPPYIKEKMVTTAFNLLKRAPGEHIYSGQSPMQRFTNQLAEDWNELDDMISRAEELQASQAMFAGKLTLIHANGQSDEIDFGLDATHNLTSLTYAWTDTTNAHPLKDLRGWQRLLVQASGISPNIVLMGRDAVDAFLAHPDLLDGKGEISSIKITRGQIDPRPQGNGVTYWGRINEIGCDLYSYNNWYVPGNLTAETELVPSNRIWMGSTEARFDRLYGAIQDLDALYAVPRFPKVWKTDDPSAHHAMLQSAPLLVPVDLDSFMAVTVCAAT